MSCAPLYQLAEGCTKSIEAMVCRKWDVFTRMGTYISTDFILSDALNNSMLELHGGSIVRKVQSENPSFPLYPFDFTEVEDIQLAESNDLIEVIGYDTTVGVLRTVGTPTKQRGLSKTLDFRLQSNTGAHIRVKMWDGVGDELLQSKATKGGMYAIILVGMHVKEFRHEVYISSTPSTMIYDSTDIPRLVEFKNRPIEDAIQTGLPADSGPQSMKIDILQMLNWCREKKRDMVFHCEAKILDIADQTPWYYFACTIGKCKKGVTRRIGNFFFTSCELPISFPKARFKIRLNIQDSTATTTVTLFDDTVETLVGATTDSLLQTEDINDESVLPNGIANIINIVHTLEIKSHTYYSIGSESFTCTNILPAGSVPVQKRHREYNTPDFPPSAVDSEDTLRLSGPIIGLNRRSNGNKKHQPSLTHLAPQKSTDDGEPKLIEAQSLAQVAKMGSTKG